MSAIIERQELCCFSKCYVFHAPERKDEPRHFDSERLSAMLDENEKNTKDKNFSFDGIMMIGHKTNDIYVVFYFSSKQSIVNLLGTKKNPVVKLYLRKNDTDKIKIHTLSFSLEQEYKLYEITESKNSRFNSIIDFQPVNELLKLARIGPFLVDSEHAKNLLHEIEANREAEEKEGFLLEGI